MRFFRPVSVLLGVLASAVALVGGLGAAPALAVVPALQVTTISAPTHLQPGGEGRILLKINNLGDVAVTGETSPVVIVDKLPVGLTATAISGAEPVSGIAGAECQLATLRCEDHEKVEPYKFMLVEIGVKVAQDAPASVVNEASVSGGGAASVITREPLTVSGAPAGFGVESLQLVPTNEDGSVDTQAGSHPFQLTTTLGVTSTVQPDHSANEPKRAPYAQPDALAKDLHFDLPPGLIGNPQVIPQCTSQEFDALLPNSFNACPAETAIGVASVSFAEPLGTYTLTFPLFNLVPVRGEPARFGFSVEHIPVILDTSVRTGGDYGVVVSVNNISQVFQFNGSQVTFWGVPADPRHNSVRGWTCLDDTFYDPGGEAFGPCVSPTRPSLIPFLTLPTSCPGPEGMRTTVQADSWTEPGVFKEREYMLREDTSEPLGLAGCNRLPFEPSISVAPDGQAGSTPTGLTVGVHVPQGGALNPTGLSPADVKDTTVALPAGIQLSPAGAGGLEACSLEQISLSVDAGPSCPDASKIATAEIHTPLLPNPLVGEVYLAAQNANPFGSLVAMYIVVEDPVSGVLVKLAGQVSLDPVTGQPVATFDSTPQLPFEDLSLHFFGSARAPLTTPALCGTYTTQAWIAPWSGNEPATPSSSFQITSGPNGAPCSDPQPFTPGFQAGSTNLQAGAFTPFTLTMSRPDADQTLSRIEMQFPPGLLGTLSTVKLCPEPQASEGACGEESLIGHTVVSVGLGNDPFTVTGGKVFITTGYKGAPYGLSILNPAKAGPFDLGTVVVRASIFVDPHTAALKIVSDPLPTILDGIPLQIQHVNVTVDREKFTFNPTNCNKMAIGATLRSTEGVAAPVSTAFQVTNCRALEFKPKFAVSTSGKTSRAKGASLHVKLTYPNTPQGAEANIRSVKVDLPKQLVARLTTLQHACLDSVFNVNPASCPAASRIGTATALTPVIPVPLTGPVYFVSHGGAKFPELIVVLQGYGVTVELNSETFISHAGITSSTFRTVPDVPVGTFELTLPQGKYSALAANGNLCQAASGYRTVRQRVKLRSGGHVRTVTRRVRKRTGGIVMPTAFTAQNGAVIKQNTPVTVTGCAKPAKVKAKHKKRAKGKKGGKKK